jgi:hypothetical protein
VAAVGLIGTFTMARSGTTFTPALRTTAS